MKRLLNQDENRRYWESRACELTGCDVSWWDINMMKIEIDNIITHLDKNDLVLDIGCSNGFTTVEIHKRVQCRIHGIDYSKHAINQAKEFENGYLNFECADITQYNSHIKYDKVYSIRCLINLMTKKLQKKALKNIYGLLKHRGIFIMSETFKGGLRNLNKARKVFGLKPLSQPVYNNYFREKEFESYISKYFDIIEVKKYASLYYIGTRLFQYLTLDDDPKEHDTDLHRFFAHYGFETKRSGDFSPQKLYVLRRK